MTGSVLTDLSKLTESSRFLAHSTEDLLAHLNYETDSSSKVTPRYDSEEDKGQIL